jgi:Rrf2 family protein
MRISAKGRYALVALIEIARQSRTGELAPVISISERFGISKLFLEQAAALLKKSGIISSVKGARGGYQLAKEASAITVLDILQAIENTLFEKSDETVSETSPATEAALREKVFKPLDSAIESALSLVTVQTLLDYADEQTTEQSFMLYI